MKMADLRRIDVKLGDYDISNWNNFDVGTTLHKLMTHSHDPLSTGVYHFSYE